MSVRDVLDWVWPTAPSLTPKERAQARERFRVDQQTCASFASDQSVSIEELEAARSRLDAALASESRRLESARLRLAAVLACTATGAAITTGLAAWAASDRTSDPPSLTELTVAVLLLYSALGFFRAGLASIHGLTRRDLRRPTWSAWVRTSDEALRSHISVQLAALHGCMPDNEEAANDVVTDLAIAFTALRNALVGMVGATAIGIGLTLLEWFRHAVW